MINSRGERGKKKTPSPFCSPTGLNILYMITMGTDSLSAGMSSPWQLNLELLQQPTSDQDRSAEGEEGLLPFPCASICSPPLMPQS